MITFGPITALQTHPLRHQVLLPHLSVEKMVYPNDEASSTFHWGAFTENKKIIGICSFFHEANSLFAPEPVYRLRGMAVGPSVKGTGVGGSLLKSALRQAQKKNIKTVWCNARTVACGFYEKLGFLKIGPEFNIPLIGPHFIMSIEVR